MKKIETLFFIVLVTFFNTLSAQTKQDKKRIKIIEKSIKDIQLYEDSVYYKGKVVALLKDVFIEVDVVIPVPFGTAKSKQKVVEKRQFFSISGDLLFDVINFERDAKGLMGMFPEEKPIWMKINNRSEELRVLSHKSGLGILKKMIDSGVISNGTFNNNLLEEFIYDNKKTPIIIEVGSSCVNSYFMIWDPNINKHIPYSSIIEQAYTGFYKAKFAIGDKIAALISIGDNVALIDKIEAKSDMKKITVNSFCSKIIVE